MPTFGFIKTKKKSEATLQPTAADKLINSTNNSLVHDGVLVEPVVEPVVEVVVSTTEPVVEVVVSTTEPVVEPVVEVVLPTFVQPVVEPGVYRVNTPVVPIVETKKKTSAELKRKVNLNPLSDN